jgi:hypothetical protein
VERIKMARYENGNELPVPKQAGNLLYHRMTISFSKGLSSVGFVTAVFQSNHILYMAL